MCNDIKLKMDYPVDEETYLRTNAFDEEGRFRIPFFSESSPSMKANVQDSNDEFYDSLIGSDEELLQRLGADPRARSQPKPKDMFQRATDAAFLDFRIDGLAMSMDQLLSGSNTEAEEEAKSDAMGIPSIKRMMEMIK